MIAIAAPATFEYIDEAFKIGVGIGMRTVDGMAHAGLRCQMDHSCETMP